MAVQKTKNLPSGASANYHRIGRFTYDGSNIDGEIHSFIDKAARDAGKTPILITSFSLPESVDFKAAKVSPYAFIYKRVVESPELGFEGATDA
jgi:hypothetical protein